MPVSLSSRLCSLQPARTDECYITFREVILYVGVRLIRVTWSKPPMAKADWILGSAKTYICPVCGRVCCPLFVSGAERSDEWVCTFPIVLSVSELVCALASILYAHIAPYRDDLVTKRNVCLTQILLFGSVGKLGFSVGIKEVIYNQELAKWKFIHHW